MQNVLYSCLSYIVRQQLGNSCTDSEFREERELWSYNLIQKDFSFLLTWLEIMNLPSQESTNS